MNKFWNWQTVKNEKEEEKRVLRLDGSIAEESWWGDETTPELFRSELNAGKGDIEVWINSPGGDCVAAAQIYNMLIDYKGDVTVKIDGIAASAASVIAMAGTTVLMSPVALMMIHNPLTFAWGNREDLEQAMQMLDEVKESIMNAYEIKSGLDRKEISAMMNDETWISAKKAVELGLADGIIGDEASAPSNAFVYSSVKVVNSMMSRIAEKTRIDKPVGRSVDELKSKLEIMKDYM